MRRKRKSNNQLRKLKMESLYGQKNHHRQIHLSHHVGLVSAQSKKNFYISGHAIVFAHLSLKQTKTSHLSFDFQSSNTDRFFQSTCCPGQLAATLMGKILPTFLVGKLTKIILMINFIIPPESFKWDSLRIRSVTLFIYLQTKYKHILQK